jgi:hypothetical protein
MYNSSKTNVFVKSPCKKNQNKKKKNKKKKKKEKDKIER